MVNVKESPKLENAKTFHITLAITEKDCKKFTKLKNPNKKQVRAEIWKALIKGGFEKVENKKKKGLKSKIKAKISFMKQNDLKKLANDLNVEIE